MVADFFKKICNIHTKFGTVLIKIGTIYLKFDEKIRISQDFFQPTEFLNTDRIPFLPPLVLFVLVHQHHKLIANGSKLGSSTASLLTSVTASQVASSRWGRRGRVRRHRSRPHASGTLNLDAFPPLSRADKTGSNPSLQHHNEQSDPAAAPPQSPPELGS
jgi:hypothetical protein